MQTLKGQLMSVTTVLIVVFVLALTLLGTILGRGELTTDLVLLIGGSLVFFGIAAILIQVIGGRLLKTADNFLPHWELQRVAGRSSFVRRFVVRNSILILAPMGAVFFGLGIAKGTGSLISGYMILVVLTIGGLYWISRELWRARESEYVERSQRPRTGSS